MYNAIQELKLSFDLIADVSTTRLQRSAQHDGALCDYWGKRLAALPPTSSFFL